MKYEIFWHGLLITTVDSRGLSDVLATFECWVDHKTGTVML